MWLKAHRVAGDSAMVRMEDAMAKHLAVPDVVEPLVPKNLTAAESTADWMSSWVRQDLYRLSALDASSAGASGRKRIFYPGGGVFEGDLSDGYWHGAGKLRFDSGEIYVGSFRSVPSISPNTQCSLRDASLLPERPALVGGWMQSSVCSPNLEIMAVHFIGRSAIFVGPPCPASLLTNRAFQKRRNERMHGKGKFVDTQGNAFEGRFVDGIPHGEGQVCLLFSRLIYTPG